MLNGKSYEEVMNEAMQSWENVVSYCIGEFAEDYDLEGLRAEYLDRVVGHDQDGWYLYDIEAASLNRIIQKYDKEA